MPRTYIFISFDIYIIIKFEQIILVRVKFSSIIPHSAIKNTKQGIFSNIIHTPFLRQVWIVFLIADAILWTTFNTL